MQIYTTPIPAVPPLETGMVDEIYSFPEACRTSALPLKAAHHPTLATLQARFHYRISGDFLYFAA
jgi:hypothetical protein